MLNNIIIFLSSKILHTWSFILGTISHKIQFWDSKISGKKKLSLDNNQLKLVKDCDHFYFTFQISEYTFSIIQKNDDKYDLKINNKNFLELLKEERIGKLHKGKEESLNKKEKENEKKNCNDYYERAKKYNGDNYVEGEEDFYDIEEQRKRLEELERKKQEEKEFDDNQRRNNGKKTFILDEKTVNINRIIICKLKDIFGNDNIEQGNNLIDLNMNIYINEYNQDNNHNNFMQNSMFNDNNYNNNILDNNPDYYLNQMNNNLNNAKNPHNQAILYQFFDLTNNNNTNINMNINNQFQNNYIGTNNMTNIFNNQFQNNNNYLNQNNQDNMIKNNQYENMNNFDDDFNLFDD